MRTPDRILADLDATGASSNPSDIAKGLAEYARSSNQYQRLAGALLYELNLSAASGLISRKALLLISQLQQMTPDDYLAPLAGGGA